MRFVTLEVWKRGSNLSVEIFKYCNKLKDFGFRDQITRSSLSVPSNIAEGMERNSSKEKTRFLNIAKSSCGELFTQIHVGECIGHIDDKTSER